MKLITLALCAAVSAQADIVGVAPVQGGGRILLHDVQGICIAPALRVDYFEAGKPIVPGCWVLRGDKVAMVFLDGDVGIIPASAVRKPERL